MVFNEVRAEARTLTPEACPLLARIEMIGARYTPDDGCPWATTEMLEGRSPFDVFVEAVQAGRGQSLSVAAVAAAVLIASRRSSRKEACEHCGIREGGARTRVGTLSKQIKEAGCAGFLPELPARWLPDRWEAPVPAGAATEQKAPKRLRPWQAMLQRPDCAEHLAAHSVHEHVCEQTALSPGRTHRVHMLQQDTPQGGLALSTYRSSAAPLAGVETKEARTRRKATARQRRRQAFKVLEFRLIECEHV